MAEPRVVTLTPNPALDVWTSTARIEPGPKLRCAEPRIDPGGGGVNVSRVLARLGTGTLAILATGGSTGDELSAALDREGVASDCVWIAGQTRRSFNVRNEADGSVLRFVLPGPTLAAEEVDTLLARAVEALRPGDLLVGSGSLPPGAGSGFWRRAAAAGRETGTRFLLDSSSGLSEAMDSGVFLLRLNHDEAAGIAGERLGWPGGAADWASACVADDMAEMVIVTEGAEGAVLATRTGRVLVRPPEVKVESAIGAGDSFMAGFCLGLLRGDTPPEALRRAVATAAATLLTPGTELARKADVERLAGACPAAVPV